MDLERPPLALGWCAAHAPAEVETPRLRSLEPIRSSSWTPPRSPHPPLQQFGPGAIRV